MSEDDKAAGAAAPTSSPPPPPSEKPAASPEPCAPASSNGETSGTATTAPPSAPPKLPPRQRLRTNEGDNQLGAPSDDAHSRKRDREGSMEPSVVSAPGMTHSASGPIPTKKNRLQSTRESAAAGESEADAETTAAAVEKDKEDEENTGDASAPSTLSNAEGVKVGQIRKRVRDLQWEGQEGDKDEGEAHKKTLVDAEAAGAGEGKGGAEKAEGKDAKADEKSKDAPATTSKSPARTQPSFSSFSSKPSAFSTAASSTSSSSPFSSAAAPAAGRTQPTFSNFSSSTSPFSKGGADVAGPSWLAGSGSSKPLGGSAASTSGPGLKPSALGSNLGKTKAASPPPAPTLASSTTSAKGGASPKPLSGTASTTTTTTSSSSSFASKPAAGGLGFGAFAGSNAFASAAKAAAAAKGGQPNGLDSESQEREGGDTVESSEGASTIVKSPPPAALSSEAKAEEDSGKPKMSALTEAELTTGEEDERSVFSARAKLYVMDPKDQSWKERGTGTIRCNVPRSFVGGRRKGARLVMRAEGVLRLILNVALFAGMKVEPPQDKFVRLVALEEGKLVHFAIKLSNPTGASSFFNVVSEHIPEEGRSSATAVTSWEGEEA